MTCPAFTGSPSSTSSGLDPSIDLEGQVDLADVDVALEDEPVVVLLAVLDVVPGSPPTAPAMIRSTISRGRIRRRGR